MLGEVLYLIVKCYFIDLSSVNLKYLNLLYYIIHWVFLNLFNSACLERPPNVPSESLEDV